MTDIVDPKTRSRMMASIRPKNTKPEMRVRRYFHAAGLRFRLHTRALPGSPDIVLKRFRTAVFVHGCFWHRHPGCPKATTPRTRGEFWRKKFDANVRRDREKIEQLVEAGWVVDVVWECQTQNPDLLAALVERIKRRENQSSTQP